MRILVLHSPYLSGPVSGENRVVEDEVRLLREAGHEVEVFLGERRASGAIGSLQEGLSAIWSRHATAKLRRLVDAHRPEIVHCHNVFPGLSPAVLRAARGGAALVMTLHNYRLICLPATLLRDGKICEDCLGRVPWRGIAHACYRDSRAGSAALATSVTLHRGLGTFGGVDLFVAVSQFVRAKHIAAGFDADRIVVKPNFAWPVERRVGPGDYFLFAGRLSEEKGVRTLIEAWRGLDARLLVAGAGPEEESLRRLAPPSVEFLGAVSADEISRLLLRARALVMPSVCYEGGAPPRSILESYAAAVPAIASAIGALPESVHDGVSGLLVPAGDPAALADAAQRLLDDADCKRMGQGAWQLWRERFGPDRALNQLEAVYDRALGRSR